MKTFCALLVGLISAVTPASASLHTLWTAPTSFVNQSVFSGDGQWLATDEGSTQATPQIWVRNARTGQVRAHFKVDGDDIHVFALVFSPDSKYLALSTGDDFKFDPLNTGSIQLWNAQTGQRLPLTFPKGKRDCIIKSLAFAPDGRTLAGGGGDEVVRLWDVASGKLKSYLYPRSYPASLSYSADGSRLMVADSENIKVWDVAKVRVIFSHHEENSDNFDATLSPDGRKCKFNETVWNCDTKRKIGAFLSPNASVWSKDSSHVEALDQTEEPFKGGRASNPERRGFVLVSDDQGIQAGDPVVRTMNVRTGALSRPIALNPDCDWLAISNNSVIGFREDPSKHVLCVSLEPIKRH